MDSIAKILSQYGVMHSYGVAAVSKCLQNMKSSKIFCKTEKGSIFVGETAPLASENGVDILWNIPEFNSIRIRNPRLPVYYAWLQQKMGTSADEVKVGKSFSRIDQNISEVAIFHNLTLVWYVYGFRSKTSFSSSKCCFCETGKKLYFNNFKYNLNYNLIS